MQKYVETTDDLEWASPPIEAFSFSATVRPQFTSTVRPQPYQPNDTLAGFLISRNIPLVSDFRSVLFIYLVFIYLN